MVATPVPWWGLLLPIVFGAPWIVASVWFWRRRPRDGAIPPSLADEARRRLWTH